MRISPYHLFKSVLLYCVVLLITSNTYSQIILEFCPVSKISASKEWSGTMRIKNDMDQSFDILEGKFYLEWPSSSSLDPGGFESAKKMVMFGTF